MKLYVGSYTRPAAGRPSTSDTGLHVCEVDLATGRLTIEQAVGGIENPSYLCPSPDGRNLHAVSEVPEWSEGVVSSYAVDPVSGHLTFQGVQGARGTVTCYAAMDTRSRVALVANYGSGSVALLPARPDGSLAEAAAVDQHTGSGPDAARQEGPHAHCIVLSPDDRFAFSADLGADAIVGYRVDREAKRLAPHATLAMPPGSGPRHLAFGPGGRHAYVIGELDSTMAALAYDPAAGILTHLESQPMLPPDVHGPSHGADVAVHPSGRFVYGSNRGHDSIALFAVDPATGRLALVGHRSTEGRTPRSFTLTPDGRFLLVANQDSDTIVTLPIDAATGRLGATVGVTALPTPVCVRFGPTQAG